jgi:hypothetical protein
MAGYHRTPPKKAFFRESFDRLFVRWVVWWSVGWFCWLLVCVLVRLFVCALVCLVGGSGCGRFVCLSVWGLFVCLVVRGLWVVCLVVHLVVGILLRVLWVASIWLVTRGHRPKRHFAESPFGCLHFAGYLWTPPKSGGCLRIGVWLVPFCLVVCLFFCCLCVVWFFGVVGRLFLCLSVVWLVVLVVRWVGWLCVCCWLVCLCVCVLVRVFSVGLSVCGLSFCFLLGCCLAVVGLLVCWFFSFVCLLVCLLLVCSCAVSWLLFVTDFWSRSFSSRVLVVRAGAPIATFFR